MPEGHTIHRLARDQQELVGRRVRATSPQGRFAEGAAAVDGGTITAIEAVGKHLLTSFDDGDRGTVHVHLGMQGKTFRFQPTDGRPPLKQVRLRLHETEHDLAWDLIAPSTCELLDHASVDRLRASLGPDPLDPHGFDHERAVANLRQAGATPIGAALIDQARIAGVGNVFRAEALLRAHLHPATPSHDLTDDDVDRLLGHLATMMKQAVDDAEIKPKLVYKQDTCLQCRTGTSVSTATIGGRTAYVCPRCQAA